MKEQESWLVKLENLLRAYKELHACIEAEYADLNATYASLSADYDPLKTTHNELKSSYDKLKTEHGTLTGDYDALKRKHSSLESEHESLQADYEDLKSDYEVATDELGNYRTYTYGLAVVTVIFIVTTIIFALRKPGAA